MCGVEIIHLWHNTCRSRKCNFWRLCSEEHADDCTTRPTVRWAMGPTKLCKFLQNICPGSAELLGFGCRGVLGHIYTKDTLWRCSPDTDIGASLEFADPMQHEIDVMAMNLTFISPFTLFPLAVSLSSNFHLIESSNNCSYL